MASAAGRRAVRVRPLRTIPGCPDAYRRYSLRPYPLLTRGAPPRPTAAAARPRPCPRSSPRTVEAARRPLFVSSARRAPGEDMALRSIACRHQDSRESSDEHELAPCRVRARRPPHASGPLGARRWRGQPDAAWRQFVLIGRFPAVLMPTDDAPQGTILTWCAARRRNEPRPPRGLDRARARSGRDLRRDSDKTSPSASVHAPPTPHSTHLTQSTDSKRSGSG